MTQKAIIISAPSGAGKTSIIKQVKQEIPALSFSVSACTRNKRPGEVNGKDYHFLTPEAFRDHIQQKDFVEWEEVYDNLFYGTLKSELDRIWQEGGTPLFEVDIKGGLNLKRYFGDQALAIFIRPPDIETLEKRLRSRGTEDEESLKKRVGKAVYELDHADQFDQVVINLDLERAIAQTRDLIQEFLDEKIEKPL